MRTWRKAQGVFGQLLQGKSLAQAAREQRRENERRNGEIHRRLTEAGIDIALRAGNLRFSPHLYNTSEEIERALALLDAP